MSAGQLPEPGTEYGPCEATCEHRDCAATRRMASVECDGCGEPIGYGVGFYNETPPDAPVWTVLVHAECLLESYADRQVPA